MDVLKNIYFAITAIPGIVYFVILIIFTPSILWFYYCAHRAEKIIKAFCSTMDIQIKNFETHKNHYGIHYLKNEVSGYQRFKVNKKGTIIWIRGMADVFGQTPNKSLNKDATKVAPIS